jgi:glutamate 5-kinase
VHMTTAAHDTTGGMAAKVQAAADIARAARAPVIIAQAGTAAGQAAVLYGSSSSSTESRGGGSKGDPIVGQGVGPEGQLIGTVVECR